MDGHDDLTAGREQDVQGPPPAVPEDDSNDVMAESGQNAPVGSGPRPEVESARIGGATPAKSKPGGLKGVLAHHKLLFGICMGTLAAVIIAGIFLAGYFVGRPGGGRTPGDPSQPSQTFTPGQQQPGTRSAPSFEPGGGMGDLPPVIAEYQEEIEAEIATVLGISPDELQEQLEDGKTIVEIAEEEGVSNEELTAAVIAKIGEIADGLAADGDISDAQAEEIKSSAESIASVLMERGRRRPSMPSE